MHLRQLVLRTLSRIYKIYNKILNKKIDDIYCLSVNDKYVMQSWLIELYRWRNNQWNRRWKCEITKYLNLISDKTKNYMGFRCKDLQW